MKIPGYVNQCIDALESAGFPTYAVGGCVRDALLGRVPQDYDLCTAALPEQTEAVFEGFPLILNGKKHGTVGVITSGGVVEITTFRTEGRYGDCRHPDWVHFTPDIVQDLARRDFTVNAMAYSPKKGFVDPFGGKNDLQQGVLRTVGDPAARFSEDALRIARGVRFAVSYRLTPEDATKDAMERLAPLMDKLARERVFDELCKLLPLMDLEDLLRYGNILAQVIPELRPTIGFNQCSPHHAYDLYTHIAHVTAGVPAQLSLRWAALLHDIGKVPTFTTDENGRGHFYGHAQKSAEMADTVLRRLKAPNGLREEVVFLIGQHMTPLPPDKKLLRRRLAQYGIAPVQALLALQRADYCGKGVEDARTDFDETERLLAQIREEDTCLSLRNLAVNGNDLMELGLRGRAVGACLNRLLDQVLAEEVPNEKSALIARAKEELS